VGPQQASLRNGYPAPGRAHCVQAANRTLRAMLEGGEEGAAAVAAELEGTRRELLDEGEVAGARFLAVLQVRLQG